MRQPALFAGVHPSIRQVVARDRAAKPLTAQDLKVAEQVYHRSLMGRCDHTPACGNWRTCVRRLAQDMRRKGFL